MNKDIALLVLRVGISLSMFINHGWAKLMGGPAKWEKVGGAMKHFGIDFLPVVFGFCGAAAESIGSILLILGALFRPAAAALALTMGVATFMHLSQGDGFKGASHAFELMLVYVALFVLGPGKYAFELKKSNS